MTRDFPGGPMGKASPSNTGLVGSTPGSGAKVLHASWPKRKNRKKKQKQYCNKLNTDFLNSPHQKNLKKKKGAYIFTPLTTWSWDLNPRITNSRAHVLPITLIRHVFSSKFNRQYYMMSGFCQ